MFYFLLLVHTALAAPAEQAWLNAPAVITRADMMELYSQVISARMNSQADKMKPIVALEARLVDREGKTHFDIVLSEEAIAKMQKQPPGQQTGDLLKIHAKMVEALGRIGEERAGPFHDQDVVQTSFGKELSDFIRSRTAADVVITVGFKRDKAAYRYASVHDGRVDFDPAAPIAKE